MVVQKGYNTSESTNLDKTVFAVLPSSSTEDPWLVRPLAIPNLVS